MLDLNKKVYKPLPDGNYTIQIKDWSLKVVPKQGSEDLEYVALSCSIPDLEDRPVLVNLFERGLDITASNIIRHDQLEDMSLAEILEHIKGRSYPATYETRQVDGETYRNWYIARLQDEDEEEAF